MSDDSEILTNAGLTFRGPIATGKVVFFAGGQEAVTIGRDGVTVNPEVPVTEAAKAVFDLVSQYLGQWKSEEILAERERCASVVEKLEWFVEISPDHIRGRKPEEYAAAIRGS